MTPKSLRQWRAGVGAIDITPREPIAMSGWGGRRISDGVAQPIFAKAIALCDGAGQRGVLLTADLLGLSREMSETLARRAREEFGLERDQLIVNSSHNHAGPVVGDLLHTYHQLSEAEYSVIARYTSWLLDRLLEAVGAALDDLSPATLHFEQGLAGFAVNRRRDSARSYPEISPRELPQIVDHDVPVLAVRAPDDALRAVVFGYACHPTSINTHQISGDYCGVAQSALEAEYPGATALFVAGCGGDQNPLPRFGRFHEELTAMYGRILAAAACNVLEARMRPVASTLQTAFTEIELAFGAPPAPEEWRREWETASGVARRSLEHQLRILERGETPAAGCPFPLHVWRVGELALFALSGEPVVDYALRFKRQYGADTTWVAGYCNELTAYIPSRRVLAEGGYEGGTGMLEYGWPAPFTDDVEESIAAAVECLHSTFDLIS